MNPRTQPRMGTSAGDSRWQRLAPIFTLVLLAPGIAEVSSGATRLSYIFVLIPEMMVWGCGALLIRDVVRRWHAGWTSMLLLGLGLSIAEEFVIQQTSLAPLPWVAAPAYGRVWGVNLIFFLFMLGFESVLVVMVPVHLTELIFPAHREQPWLKVSGWVISSLAFLAGSYLAWFMWIKIARAKVFHVPPYQPSLLTILAGVVMVALLVLAGYALRNVGQQPTDPPLSSSASAPSPWIVGIVTVLFGFPWYALMALIFGPRRNIPLWIPVVAAITWAGLAYIAAWRFTFSPNWSDTHRWAAIFCAALVCMMAGFLGSGTWSRMDLVAKAILNVLIVAGLIWLALRISRRSKQPSVGFKM
jgi:hypothetical protein